MATQPVRSRRPAPAPRAPVARDAARESWFGRGGASHSRLVPLFELDPSFARRLAPADRQAAFRHTLVTTHVGPRGPWRPPTTSPERSLGLLILGGTLLRGRRVEDRWSTEILGAHDVLRPWDDADEPDGIVVEDTWTAVEPVRLAVLDRRFAIAAGRWPALLDELLARSVRRARFLSTLLSVAGIRRLDLRLLVLLNLLADRWGYVARDGVHLRLRLTHENLGRLACAQRPSVSTALARLTREGHLLRRQRELVLPLDLPQRVEAELQAA
jgi:CRP/FNR family cyclic AMP-dependent transcriptional regulator